MADKPIRLLLVCLGNICRSPMMEGALRARLAQAGLSDAVIVDSAGTGNWHIGDPPDPRAIATAMRHGVDISGLRGRQLDNGDYSRFDWLLCADHANVRNVKAIMPPRSAAGIELFTEWAGLQGAIPDPYTGTADDFEQVWLQVDATAGAAASRLRNELAHGGVGKARSG